MHVVIATVGTRGDVQPYVALGKELTLRGHAVTIASNTDHRELIEAHGLAHRGVCGSFRELLSSPAGRRWIESADPIRYMSTARALFEPVARRWVDDFDGALADADVVLSHSATPPSLGVCRGQGKRFLIVSPFPSIPSREIGFGLPEIPIVTGLLNRVGFGLFLDQFWKIGAREVAAYQRARGAAPSRRALWREHVERAIPHLHLYSEHVIPRPADWPGCAEVLGYCFLDEPSWQPPAALLDYLASGPPPVYVGFGSMTGMDPERLAQLTRDAVRRARTRAVIGMGWGGMRGFAGADDLFVVEDVPHAWLFPRVSAVVQHCGAGTVAAALRAGRPIVAVPFFADQPAWANILHAHGVAPAPVPRRTLTPDRLAGAITAATTDPRYAARAAQISARLATEQGAVRAADRVLHHLA